LNWRTQRAAGGHHRAGFLCDDDGVGHACEYVEVCEQEGSEGRGKERGEVEYKANVKAAVGVLKDRLILMVAEEDDIVRDYVWRELGGEIKRRVIPIRPNRKIPRKEYLKKPHFHHNHKSNC